jgi:glucose-6-phosphate 1-dehydrogenase
MIIQVATYALEYYLLQGTCKLEGRMLDIGDITLHNPLRAGLSELRTVQPCIMVIFGATGDLTQRKLLPALYSLATDQPPLPASFTVVGVARRPWSNDFFRSYVEEGVKSHARQPYTPAQWETFSQGISYVQVEFDDDKAYFHLKEVLDELDRQRGTAGNRIFYLATPPRYYSDIVSRIGQAGLVKDGPGWCRVIVEKPFGHDKTSARQLNSELSQVFKEDQIFRIDHYLGKETVQNILVLRFSNGIFEPIWDRRYIDHVQITVAENIGVEGRGGYYEEAGALRDMVQNHLLQLLTLVAMEPPSGFGANVVRDEKVKVLHAVVPIAEEDAAKDTIRAQYGMGWLGAEQLRGYLQEQGVPPGSQTETFVAAKLHIDNWRWAGVPFYLRTGKRLPKRVTEVAIQFKRPPFSLFRKTGTEELQPNILLLRIQPNEGISLKFGVKLPGQSMRIRAMNMDFLYGSSFGSEPPEAYERLLLDAMVGDSTLFTRRDETEAAWEIVDAIETGWHVLPQENPMHTYDPGTWGPHAADDLIERDGRLWRRL